MMTSSCPHGSTPHVLANVTSPVATMWSYLTPIGVVIPSNTGLRAFKAHSAIKIFLSEGSHQNIQLVVFLNIFEVYSPQPCWARLYDLSPSECIINITSRFLQSPHLVRFSDSLYWARPLRNHPERIPPTNNLLQAYQTLFIRLASLGRQLGLYTDLFETHNS
jgi:hypothetical protein